MEYQELANAIIEQAAKDFRTHGRYLVNHKKTDELVKSCEKERRNRIRKIKAWKTRQKNMGARDKSYVKQPVPKEYRILTDEEKELYSIIKHEAGIKEIEAFFNSKWFGVLTKADSRFILEQLREEFV